eukprot:scaffold140258_cov33-Prasinocladus_malaysianus.AAC.1
MDSSMSSSSPVGDVAFSQYKLHLRKLAVLRMCSQLSQVYSVIKIERLQALVPFMKISEIET